jgi:hypothetical protein
MQTEFVEALTGGLGGVKEGEGGEGGGGVGGTGRAGVGLWRGWQGVSGQTGVVGGGMRKGGDVEYCGVGIWRRSGFEGRGGGYRSGKVRGSGGV